MQVEIDNLRTVKNYADMQKVTTGYIYKLMREGKMKPVIIDDVKFVDVTLYPKLRGR